MAADLETLIAAELARWHNPYPLEQIFHMADPQRVVEYINTFCERELGSGIASTSFYEVSIGIVCGLQLHNGARIVIKLLSSTVSTDFLRAVVRIQHYLRARDYPCTRPLYGPLPLVAGIAMVEELDDAGEYHDAHEPKWRKTLAELLAWQINLLRQPECTAGLDPHLFDRRLPPDVLWGRPHSNIFDFEATARGAEWIDELAWKAKSLLNQADCELVLGHGDWSTKHVRYIGDRAHIVYDWDSLKLDIEPSLVANAAVTFTYIPFMEGVVDTPSPEEALAFVDAYESARGTPFTAAQRKMVMAGMILSLAYGARCEHSLAPHEHEYPDGSRRALLKLYRDNIL